MLIPKGHATGKAVNALAFSRDAMRAACSHTGKVVVWDVDL